MVVGRECELGSPLFELPVVPVPALEAARGTIVALDWRVLRQLGLYDSYASALDPSLRDAVLFATAGSWVPLDGIIAHYAALDSLRLDETTRRLIGWLVAEGVHGSLLTTLLRMAGSFGVTPWLPLERSNKLWERSWKGGALLVHRVGEQSAELQVLEAPICASPFFRSSFAGVLAGSIAPFGKVPTAQEIVSSRGPSSVTYHVSWTR